MDLDASAVQAQNFTLVIHNFLFLKLVGNSLYGYVFHLFAKPHVNCMTVLEFFGNALHLHLFSAVYNHSRISVSIFFLVFSRLVCAFLSFTYFHLPIISGTIKDCKRKACCKFSLIFIMCEFETSHFIICKAIFVSSFVQYVLLLKIFGQFFFSLSYEVVFLFCPFYWVVHNNNSYFLSLTFMSKV